MTLRESLGGDVRHIYDQIEALLDREDGILAFFDGNRVITYAHGFEVSASQLELLGVELERAFRCAVGRQPVSSEGNRRNHEGHERDRNVDGIHWMVAALLAAYFDWRARLLSQIRRSAPHS